MRLPTSNSTFGNWLRIFARASSEEQLTTGSPSTSNDFIDICENQVECKKTYLCVRVLGATVSEQKRNTKYASVP